MVTALWEITFEILNRGQENTPDISVTDMMR